MNRMVFLAVVLLLIPLSAALAQQTKPQDPDLVLKDGDTAFRQKNYNEARIQYEIAFKLFQEGNQKEGTALSSFKLGRACIKVGKFSQALEALQRAMTLHTDLNDRQAVGFDLSELAFIAAKQSRYEDSLKLSQQALAIHQELGNRKGIADTYRTIGLVYQFQGDEDKSTDYTQRSLAIATELGDKEGQVMCLINFGGTEWKRSNFDQALDYYGKASQLNEELGDPKIQSQILGNTALIYWNRGQLQKALDSFNRSLALSEQIGDQQTSAINTFNVGALYKDLEEYGKSQELLQKSVAMAEQIGDRGLLQACLDALGQLHGDLGEYDIALDFLQKAAKIAEEIGEKRSLAYDLKSISYLYWVQSKLAQAIPFDRKALSLFEEIQEKRGIATTLNDLGEIYLTMNNDKEAFVAYEKALPIAIEMKSDFILTDTYRGLGWIHFHRKEFRDAEDCFSKSIDLSRSIERPQSLAQALNGMGLVYRDTGRAAEALQLMKEAVDLIEKARSEVPLAEQRAGYMEQQLDLYGDVVRLLVNTKDVAGAFEYAQRSKARSFLDMLAESRIDPETNLDPSFREPKKKLLKEFADAEREIEGESENDTVDQAKLRQLAKKRDELEDEFKNLLIEIGKQNPRFAGLQYPQPLPLEQAKGMLDSRTAILEYFLGKEGSIVFVITQNGAQVYPVTGEERLAQQIRELRAVMLKPEPAWQVSEGSYTKYAHLAEELYRELIAPAERDLKHVQRVIIAPDGILNYLPFESLLRKSAPASGIDFSALSYLTNDFEIEYAPSSTVFAALKIHEGAIEAPNELLAFADPGKPAAEPARGKTRSSSGDYPPLPNARLEVEGIARLFPPEKVAIFEGQAASEEKLKKMKLTEYKRLHFASHGVIDEQNPEFSSILLSTPQKGTEDGYLMTQEIFDLKLNADLVVLSACKTGLGRQIRGEGIMGLSRAFLCAGASSVLASLWNVPDASTAQFMTDFYRSMVTKGMSKTEALKKARLELIRSGKFSHPYYWAPFVLIGN